MRFRQHMRRQLPSILMVTMLTLIGVANSACDIALTTDFIPPATSNNRPSTPTVTEIPLPDPIVTVILANESDVAVDTQLFVLNDVNNPQVDELFAERNQFRRGIGFLSLGILAPGEIVEVTLDCGSALTVGTTGGQFLDPETGDEITNGDTPRTATLGPQFDCLGTVVFTYRLDENGVGTSTLGL